MSTTPSGRSRPTTQRIEITQQRLDGATHDPEGRRAIIDALREAGMTGVWVKGGICSMTHPDGRRRQYSLTTRVNRWQLDRMRNPGEAQPFTLVLDDRAAAGWMEGEPISSTAEAGA